ncbi:MAG: LacI family DNA-binding transcriptional regulator [Pseudomonadota bacterium]
MAEKVTSTQVAERAGVSRSAVSRVFTPGASASAATVEKVKAAAEELGYRPNVIARSLLTGRSRMIGLVATYLDNLFYPGLIEELSTALQAEGYHILMFMAGPGARDVDDVVDAILDYQVGGLVLASVMLSSDLAERCRDMGVPVVLLNRRQGEPDEVAVVSDNMAGGRLAAEHLVSQGARRIGHIAGWETASTQREREAGLLAGLRDAGLGLYAREVGNFNAVDARKAALAMFSEPEGRPDAVFVANDFMALIVIDTLRHELGIDVPGDVRIVGFDDVPAAAWMPYGLTTVRQDASAMVAQTVDLLLGRAESAMMLPVELIHRQTS